jgi:N-acetylglucosamine-6-sulfatase
MVALTMLICVACDPAPTQSRGDQPNVILLLVDDLRWDEVGYAGYPVPTPNIDSLAAKGVRFDRAYVASSLCSPSRASFLTGTYPHTHGVVGNRSELDFEKTPTIASLLQDEGYETAMIGKWHMGQSSDQRPGFDYWYSTPGHGRYIDPIFQEGKRKPVEVKGYSTDLITDRAIEFIAKNSNQPFYLHLSYKAVHEPFTPAPRHVNSLDVNAFKMKSPNSRVIKPEQRQKRAESLLAIDDSVGRIVSSLEEYALLDNTVLVFTSDNGFLLGEHGLGDKRIFYEESIRIPWVVHFPRLPASGTAIDKSILNIDFLPTMLDLVGVEIPQHIEGTSFAPLLNATDLATVDWRSHWVYEYFNEEEHMGVPTHLAVIDQRYKYVRFPEGPGLFKKFSGEDLLFDLQTDPYEMTNLAGQEGAGEIMLQMRRQLQQFAKETNFRFIPLDPERVNARIQELYNAKPALWYTKALDKAYPDGYPGWEAPVPEPL